MWWCFCCTRLYLRFEDCNVSPVILCWWRGARCFTRLPWQQDLSLLAGSCIRAHGAIPLCRCQREGRKSAWSAFWPRPRRARWAPVQSSVWRSWVILKWKGSRVGTNPILAGPDPTWVHWDEGPNCKARPSKPGVSKNRSSKPKRRQRRPTSLWMRSMSMRTPIIGGKAAWTKQGLCSPLGRNSPRDPPPAHACAQMRVLCAPNQSVQNFTLVACASTPASAARSAKRRKTTVNFEERSTRLWRSLRLAQHIKCFIIHMPALTRFIPLFYLYSTVSGVPEWPLFYGRLCEVLAFRSLLLWISVHYWVELNFCGPVEFSVQLKKSNVCTSCLDYILIPASQKWDFKIAHFFHF